MNKKNLGLYFLYLLVVLSSCEDEFVADNTNCYDNVTFGVKIGSDQQISSRAADEAQPLKEITVKEISSEFRGKPLYLHTIVQDYKPQEEKTQENEKQSRGAVRDKNAVTDLGVSGVIYNEDWTESGRDDQILYFYNLDLDVTNYTASTNYYWPMQNEKMRVFAYSPYSASGMSGFTKTAVSPSFDYEVPAEAADQVDLLVASNEVAKAEYGDPIDLTFGHALTAIQVGIKTDVNDVTIKSVKILNVKSAGSYTFNYDKDKDANPDTEDVKCRELGAWTGQNKIVESYNVPLTDIPEGKSDMVIPADITSDVIFNKEDDILMLMPQQLDGAKLQITLVDNKEGENYNKEVTKTIDLTGEWIKGQHLIYYLSASDLAYEYVLEVVDSNTGKTLEYYGGVGEFTVKSYKRTKNAFGRTFIESVPWEITEIPEGYDMPIGLSEMTLNGKGVDNVALNEGPFKYVVLPNLTAEANDPNSSHSLLRSAKRTDTENGTTKEKAFDLSYSDGNNYFGNSRNTANCYIVKSPAYYKFPLVYGNAIKNGNENNTEAFEKVGAGPITKSYDSYAGKSDDGIVSYNKIGAVEVTVNQLKNFKDHKGENIKGAWISEQGGAEYIPVKAEIVWQDEPWLVTELELCDENGKAAGEEGVGALKYIRFRVNEQSICEGNALIAVKNSKDEIMWSWHIWVSKSNTSGSKNLWNRRIPSAGNAGVVTDKEPSRGDAPIWKNYLEAKFVLMLAQVGQCSSEIKTYNARTINVKIKQNDPNPYAAEQKTASFSINVGSGEVKNAPNAPYYQWGRKDPMLPYGLNGENKKYYNNVGEQQNELKTIAGPQTIAWSIQHPDYFITSTSDSNMGTSGKVTYRNWCEDIYINLWNNNCKTLPMYSDRYVDRSTVHCWDFHDAISKVGANEEFGWGALNVEKTVYDPCPPGWEMPRMDAFSGVSYEGVNESPYWTTTSSYNSPFFPNINLVKQRPWIASTVGSISYPLEPDAVTNEMVCEVGISTNPMIVVDKRDIGNINTQDNENIIWFMGYGHRAANGKLSEYDNFINIVTSGLMCIQWTTDAYGDGVYKEAPFLLSSSRLCVIRNSDKGNSNYGGLRPFSASTLVLGFNVVPAKTSGNPVVCTTYNAENNNLTRKPIAGLIPN